MSGPQQSSSGERRSGRCPVDAETELWFEELGHVGPSTEPAVLLMSSAHTTALIWPESILRTILRSGRRVIRFDTRDIGLSTWPSARGQAYTLDRLCSDAVCLIDHLGLDRVDVVGLSMGGMIAQLLALSAPQRVGRLVLIATTADPSRRLLSPRRPELISELEHIRSLDLDDVDRAVAVFEAFAGSRFAFDATWYRQLVVDELDRGTNRSPTHADAMSSAAPWIERLPEIVAPTLVIHGSEDASFPIDHGRTLAERIPRATLVEWAGVGHEVPPLLHDQLARLIVARISSSGAVVSS